MAKSSFTIQVMQVNRAILQSINMFAALRTVASKQMPRVGTHPY